ncbi:MAG: tetratricopeptide repeat protein [Methanosarcinales archaeon]|nr:MAG: tetratricopeptide repeat protein [Methanosarcinales archaeon]
MCTRLCFRFWKVWTTMSDNEQELLKLETEVYHSDGGIYFAGCDTASTRDEMARRLEDRFSNKNVKVIKINVRMAGAASTRDEIAQLLDDLSLDKDEKISELNVLANDLTYAVTRYHGDAAAFFVYLPFEKSELEDLARILNYTREEFAKIKQPIIIWADKVSLGVIARSAPDFWAWRARVSEFAGVSGHGGGVEAVDTIWREKISDEEIQSYERALEEFQKQGDKKEAANILEQLGILYYRRSEWDRAIEYYEKNMEIFEALGNRHGLASTYGNLGSVYYRKGEWDRAIEYYEKSMKIKEALGDRHGLASTYGNLGSVYYRKGEWDRAIEYYEKDMEIFEALGDRHGLASTHNNLGLVYADRGEWDRAIEYYEKSMEISEALGDRHGLAQTYNNLGLVYARKGEWDRAIEYYEKDMEIFEALGDRHGLASTYNNLGLVYADKGEWDRAIEYHEKSMKIKEALGDRHGTGITLSNIGMGYFNRSDPVSAKRYLEEAIRKIHPDARPEYPNAINWLAVSLRMIADQKKREAKLASSDVEREKLVTAAAELYREAGERYEETHRLPLARMPRSLLMDAHLTRGLSYSVQNITEEDAHRAAALLDDAIKEMKAALEFADGADAIKLKGAIASHEAKRCVREISLCKDDKKRDHLLDLAISYLRKASESFDSLGKTGACSSKTCDGCRHLYTALGLIRDGYKEGSNQKIMDAVFEIRSAEKCYKSISNELGMDVVNRVNEILRRVADNLKNVEGFDPGGAVDATNNVSDALDEIAGVGLRNMIKILVWDEAGNVTEKKIPEGVTIGGEQKTTVIGDHNVIQTAGRDIEQIGESLPEKRKPISRWDLILGAISGFSVDVIAIILMHYYFEESVKSHPILLVTFFVVAIFTTILIRKKLLNSNT